MQSMIVSYDFFIHSFMTTVSVPLSAEMLSALEMLIKQGVAPNKAAAIRKAIAKYLEDQAVEVVLRASKEPTLYGDLDTLLKKL